MKYEVWATQGQGNIKVARFNTLDEALGYVRQHYGEASFGIKQPDGTWHEWAYKETMT